MTQKQFLKSGDLKNYASHLGVWNDENKMSSLKNLLMDLGWEDSYPATLLIRNEKMFLSVGKHRLSLIIKMNGENYLVPVRIKRE